MPKKSKDFLNSSDNSTEKRGSETELYNFPSIGRLFESGEPERLEELRAGFERARNDLDIVIRKGTNEQAVSAAKAQKAISVTLEFLDNLEKQKYT